MRYVKGLTRRLCVELAKRRKAEWARRLSAGSLANVVPAAGRKVPLDVASFSSSGDCPEQCLSLLTFSHWVGQPRSWTVYSDGTHTARDKALLESLGSFVHVVPWNANLDRNPASGVSLLGYSSHPTQHAMGKRLTAYSLHPLEGPALFLDSDVFFYKKAFEMLIAAVGEPQPRHWFLPDVHWGHLDTRYMAAHQPEMYQLNGGFFLIWPFFDWTQVTRTLDAFSPDFQYFSDQTSYHIGFMGQGAAPLDPRLFVLDASDQFLFGTNHAPAEMALRHYTGPVRHKAWQFGWKWHFTG